MSGNQIYVKQFGTRSTDDIRAMTTGTDGYIYVGGYTTGSFFGYTLSGTSDAFVAKYDTLGNQIWLRQFGTTGSDQISAMTTGTDGSIYVGGYTTGSFPDYTLSGPRDAFIAKYDTLGNQIWLRQFGTTGSDQINAMTTGTDGSIYVGGYTLGSFPDYTLSGTQDAFLVKYDTLGNQIWVRQFGTTNTDYIQAMTTGIDGYIYIGGYTYGSFSGYTLSGTTDAFLVKYDTLGNQIWLRQFGTTSSDYIQAMTTGTDGSIYVGGYTTGSFPDYTRSGSSDAFIVKYDTLGNQIWVRQFGTTAFDYINAMTARSDGTIYVGGYTTGSFSGYALRAPSDVFIAKYGYTAFERKSSGASAIDLYNEGYPASQLQAAGYSISDLQGAGYSDSSILGAGYSASDLKTAGYSASNLKTAGYSASNLKTAGYTLANLKGAGYTLTELCGDNTTQASVRFYYRDTIGDGWNGGSVTIKETSTNATVITLTGPTIIDRSTASKTWYYTTGSLNPYKNYTLSKINGASSAEIYYAITLSSQTQYANTSNSIGTSNSTTIGNPIVLSQQQLSTSTMNTFTAPSFGFTVASQLTTLGYTVTQLDEAGYSYTELSDAGYSYTQLSNAGYTIINTAQTSTISSGTIYVLYGSGNINVTGNVTITNVSSFTGIFTVSTGVTATVSSGTIATLSGSGTINVTNDVTITTASSFTGTLQVIAGTATIGSLSSTATIILAASLNSSSTIAFSGNSVANNISVTGFGTNVVKNTSTMNVLTLSGILTKNGTKLTFDGPITVTGPIEGTTAGSDVIVTNNSIVTFTNENTYNGPTTINSWASLTLDNSTIANSDVTIQNGGLLIIKNSSMPETANVKTVTLETGGSLDLTVGYLKTTEFTTGASSIRMDAVKRLVIVGNLTITGGLTINVSGQVSINTTYDIISYTGSKVGAETIAVIYNGTTPVIVVSGAFNGNVYRIVTKPLGAMSGNQIYVKQFGTTDTDTIYAMTTGTDGSIYVGGSTYGSFPGYTIIGYSDAFVAKYNTSGTQIWLRQFGAINIDQASIQAGIQAMTTGTDGSIYVGGYTQGSFPGYTNRGSTDAFVAKYDTLGNQIWVRQFGTTGNDRINAMTTGTDGSIYVGGYTGGSFSGYTLSGTTDAFVAKYDILGNQIWLRQFGTTSDDQINAMTTGIDGSIYVGGYTYGSFPGYTRSVPGTKPFVAKYDTLGNQIWLRQFGTTGADGIDAMTTGIDGSIYIGGYTYGSFQGYTLSGPLDAFVSKYDTLGNQIWLRQFGTTSYDNLKTMRTGTDGSIYVGGYTSGSFPDYTTSGDNDVFVAKYDTLGNQIWVRQFGTTGNDRINAMTNCSDGTIYVGGYTSGSFMGYTNSGSQDQFFAKYGYTVSERIDTGASLTDLYNEGYPASQLQAAGYSASDLKGAGYSASSLKGAGYSASSLKDAGYSISNLQGAGYSDSSILGAGYSASSLKDAGYTTSELYEAGFTIIITSTQTVSINEDTTAAYSVIAESSGTNTISYSISDGGDSSKFNINSTTGAITFKDPPNYEVPTDNGANNTYNIIVTATNSSDNTYDTKAIAINVLNVVGETLSVSNIHVVNKTYDGTTNATVTGSLDGVSSGHDVSLVLSGSFTDVFIGNDKRVVVTASLSGADAGEYSIIQPTGNYVANITGNVCFPAGTLVLTNQGYIPIEQIDKTIHTIRNKPIVVITQTVTDEKQLIRIAKHALNNNYPSKTTLITQNHQVMFMGKMIKAKDLVGLVDKVTRVPYTGELLYNVLLETHEKMQVNNLIVETLHPEHKIAQLYHLLKMAKPEERNEMITRYNHFERQYKESLKKYY